MSVTEPYVPSYLRQSGTTINGLPTVSVANIAALRLYIGPSTTAVLPGKTTFADGDGGSYSVKPLDTTTADDGDGVIVDALGRRWWKVGLISKFASLVEALDDTIDNKVMSPETTFESIRVITTHINIKEKRFAGGAPMNGIDDDTAAFQAAIDYYKPMGQYDPEGAPIAIPRGQVRLDTASLDVTNCHGTNIVGSGQGVTFIRGTGNRPLITWTNDSDLPLTGLSIKNLTLYGPGYANTQADGIRAGANNNCNFDDLRIWACRRGIVMPDSWQSFITRPRINGLGGLSCYDGIVLPDGDLDVEENGVEINGGQIAGCQQYGFRGEKVTGSKVFGLEVLGCSGAGVYLGDSPGGADLKWFDWTGGLIDTCSSLLVIRKGSAPLADLLTMHFGWLGYANGGAGVGIDVDGLTRSTIGSRLITNTVYAANIVGCVNSNFDLGLVTDYDRIGGGGAGVIVNNTTDCAFRGGAGLKTSGSPSITFLVEQGTAARNNYGGFNVGGAMVTLGGNGSVLGADVRHVVNGASILASPTLQVFTMATLPAASSVWKDRLIDISDEAGGYVTAFCDGTNWRRVTDRAVVS